MMSIAVCRPAASGWYSVLIRFQAASDVSLRFRRESARFSSDCVHQKIVQMFRIELRLRSELCERFLRQPCERTFHRGSRLAMATTDSKMNDHSLHSMSRPEEVGHLFINRSARCRCGGLHLAGLPTPVTELLRAVGALLPGLGQLLQPLPCSVSTTVQCNGWSALRYHVAMCGWQIFFLTHHEKAVRTRCQGVRNTEEHWLVRRRHTNKMSARSLEAVHRKSTRVWACTTSTGSMKLGILYIVLEEPMLRWKHRGMQSRNCISVNSQTHWTFSAGRSTNSSFLQSQCHGPKKWRWRN